MDNYKVPTASGDTVDNAYQPEPEGPSLLELMWVSPLVKMVLIITVVMFLYIKGTGSSKPLEKEEGISKNKTKMPK